MFLINRGDLDIRLDPFYYKPEFLELEKIISKKTVHKLRHYILYLASGATPHKAEAKKYYSDEINGIPFLRVQNVTPSSHIQLQDVKYINLETHQGMLKRSQIKEGDLLIKITGVGRMAVSAVVPENFEANINQHLVVIRTNNKETSEIIAAFLNSDIGETLAKRRSTGGTRPALDYAALRSIPIIFDKRILEIQKQANQNKKQKEAQASALLASIDSYLLQELGITLPSPSEKKTYFYRNFSKLSGGRFDPFYHQVEFETLEIAINESKYDKYFLSNILNFLESGSRPSGGVSQYESGILSFGGEHLNNKCEIEIRTPKYIPIQYHKSHLLTETKLHDILLVKDGATTGKIGILTDESHIGKNINEHVFMMRFKESVNSFFIINLLANSLYQKLIGKMITGATVTGLTKSVVRNLIIPLPPLEKQTEIANYINAIRAQAKQLQQEASAELEHAKQQVEQMILGE